MGVVAAGEAASASAPAMGEAPEVAASLAAPSGDVRVERVGDVSCGVAAVAVDAEAAAAASAAAAAAARASAISRLRLTMGPVTAATAEIDIERVTPLSLAPSANHGCSLCSIGLSCSARRAPADGRCCLKGGRPVTPSHRQGVPGCVAAVVVLAASSAGAGGNSDPPVSAAGPSVAAAATADVSAAAAATGLLALSRVPPNALRVEVTSCADDSSKPMRAAEREGEPGDDEMTAGGGEAAAVTSAPAPSALVTDSISFPAPLLPPPPLVPMTERKPTDARQRSKAASAGERDARGTDTRHRVRDGLTAEEEEEEECVTTAPAPPL